MSFFSTALYNRNNIHHICNYFLISNMTEKFYSNSWVVAWCLELGIFTSDKFSPYQLTANNWKRQHISSIIFLRLVQFWSHALFNVF